MISQGACCLDILVEALAVVPVNKKILILVDSHVEIVTRLVAFSRLGASVANHDTFKSDSDFSLRHLVFFDNKICEVRNVYSSVALACNIKVVLFKIWEFLNEKHLKSFKIVLSNTAIVVFC